MRSLIAGLVALTVVSGLRAADAPPLVEKYLHSGELAKGEQALEAALAATPDDDQVRYGLGVLRFVRGVERLGQGLHEYGAKSENNWVPFLRLPVPKNSDPASINYTSFRRILDDFDRDLFAAEAILAGVTNDKVKLPLRLASIKMDLDGDGKPTDKLIDIMKKVMGRVNFAFLEKNPDFLVSFDRGDVAWMRAYCHLLMGMLDFYLAFDLEREFNFSADQLFAKPKHVIPGTPEERWQKFQAEAPVVQLKEPARLGRFRKHITMVAVMNRETWKHIRAETDDEDEWLPNPKQKGIFGMPVRTEMIDGWLNMMGELEALFEGRRTMPKNFGIFDRNGKGLNLKVLFDEPPEKFVLNDGFLRNLPDKYFTQTEDVNVDVIIRAFFLFSDSTAVAYAAWFN